MLRIIAKKSRSLIFCMEANLHLSPACTQSSEILAKVLSSLQYCFFVAFHKKNGTQLLKMEFIVYKMENTTSYTAPK